MRIKIQVTHHFTSFRGYGECQKRVTTHSEFLHFLPASATVSRKVESNHIRRYSFLIFVTYVPGHWPLISIFIRLWFSMCAQLLPLLVLLKLDISFHYPLLMATDARQSQVTSKWQESFDRLTERPWNIWTQ